MTSSLGNLFCIVVSWGLGRLWWARQAAEFATASVAEVARTVWCAWRESTNPSLRVALFGNKQWKGMMRSWCLSSARMWKVECLVWFG